MLCRDEDEVRQKAKELRLVERPRRDVLSAHPHTANSSAMTITKENAGSELSFRQGVMLEKLIRCLVEPAARFDALLMRGNMSH